MLNMLFSFSGRATRFNWWMGQLTVVGLYVAAGIVVGIAAGGGELQTGDISNSGTVLVVMLAAIVVGLWINLATTVKRFHDRNKSGIWFFIAFVPFIGGLWLLVECGFLAGTPGANAYGSDNGYAGSAEAYVNDMGSAHGRNMDDIIQSRLTERQTMTSAPMAVATGAAPTMAAPARPVFGKRT